MTKKLIGGIAALTCMSGICWATGMAAVDQKALAFSVPKLTLAKGSIVSFTNSDTTSHNILISGNGVSLNSGLQRPGVSFKAPFMKEGTYQVICGIHPKMKMTVVVQ